MADTLVPSKNNSSGVARFFATLWSSAVVSSVGDGAYVVAAPLLAAFITHDPLGVAVVSAASAAPWFLVSFWAGAVVDRFSRRVVFIVSELVRGLGLGSLVLLIVAHSATIPALAFVSFVVVTGQCFSDPAAQALVPQVVGRDEAVLTRANGQLYAGETVGKSLVGPPLGGLTFAAAPWVPFAVDAISFTASAALVWRIPKAAPSSSAQEQSLRSAVREGFSYLRRDRSLILLALALAVYNITYYLAAATMVLFAKSNLGLSDTEYGVLIAASAIGAIAAGWAARPLLRVLTVRGTVIAVCVGQGLAWLLAGLSSSVWLAGIAFVVLGATSTLVTVAVVSERQHVVRIAF